MKLKLKVVLLSIALILFIGCASTTRDVQVVKSYKTVNNYKTVSIVRGSQNRLLDEKVLENFEDLLFDELYSKKGSRNFIPGDNLKLKYEILNIQYMKKHLTDWGTYFGKDNSQFDILFTIYDKYNKEIGLYHVSIDVEYWLFPTNAMMFSSAFDAAIYTISQHLKVNYLYR